MMKKADVNSDENVVANAVNAHAEDILTDIRAAIKLLRRDSVMDAVDVLLELERDLQRDYAEKSWQSSLRGKNLR